MKNRYYLFTAVLMGLLFASCKKDDIAYNNDFERSYRALANYKASTGNSYRYTVNTSSWIGATSQTIITVESGRVTHRSYVLKSFANNSNMLVVREEWTENETTLNTHSNGAATMTLDEIYEKAKTEWLLKRKDATTYLETENDGMISLCGYVPDNCADDCFTGIHISLIEKL